MSLPNFSTQSNLFSTAAVATSLFGEADRYRLFAQFIYPRLVAARPELESCYCLDNGRIAIEPVLLLVSVFSNTWTANRIASPSRCCATTQAGTSR